MTKYKLITTLVLAFAFLFAQVGNVAAAPLAQDPTPITGNIVSVTPEADAEGVITVLVELEGGQIVRISEATAIGLELLVVDPATNEPVLDPVTNLPLVNDSQIGQPVEIPAADVIADETPEEEPVHPISALLAAFFNEDASVIDGYHTDGFGFGVIAQALWMSKNLADDASLTEDILVAKQDKDYETFFTNHPEFLENFDGTVPTNWGQFKKALLEKHNNLGNVVSGHAEEDENSSLSVQENGQGHGKGHGKNNGHGKGHNKP
jgi:hypothetical protein